MSSLEKEIVPHPLEAADSGLKQIYAVPAKSPHEGYHENTLNWALNKLFRKTSLVLVGGIWKTGKTDFALYIAKRLLKLGLVYEVASNIDTNGEFIKITDTQTLKQWLASNGHLKLFIFDEGNEHLANTDFMTTKSKGFKEVIPQISKKHGRLIIIGQDIDSLDKTFRNKSWWRGTFKKVKKDTAELTAYWSKHKPLRINGIPKTSVVFDPYVSAEWFEAPEKTVFFKDEDRQILWALTHGKKAKELGLHNQQVSRLYQKYVRQWLEQDNRPTVEESVKVG